MRPLPNLLLSRAFMEDFAGADAPCFGMSLVETAGKVTGCLAMQPDMPIESRILAKGFAFGHRLSEIDGAPLCQFVFSFYGGPQYSALVNPSNPIVRTVLQAMVDQQDYFFFVLDELGSANAFRSNLETDNLVGLRDSLFTIRSALTKQSNYDAGIAAFRRTPDPPSTLLRWVCYDDAKYLDLDSDPVILRPVG